MVQSGHKEPLFCLFLFFHSVLIDWRRLARKLRVVRPSCIGGGGFMAPVRSKNRRTPCWTNSLCSDRRLFLSHRGGRMHVHTQKKISNKRGRRVGPVPAPLPDRVPSVLSSASQITDSLWMGGDIGEGIMIILNQTYNWSKSGSLTIMIDAFAYSTKHGTAGAQNLPFHVNSKMTPAILWLVWTYLRMMVDKDTLYEQPIYYFCSLYEQKTFPSLHPQ